MSKQRKGSVQPPIFPNAEPTDPKLPVTNQNQAAEISDLKERISELSTLVLAFSKRANKTERVAIYPNVCFTDSSRAKPARSQTISQKRSRKRKANKNHYRNKLRTHNEKFIKNISNRDLTDQETALLAKGLKCIPTPPPASHKSLLKCI